MRMPGWFRRVSHELTFAAAHEKAFFRGEKISQYKAFRDGSVRTWSRSYAIVQVRRSSWKGREFAVDISTSR
jgi:hypothetical protein